MKTNKTKGTAPSVVVGVLILTGLITSAASAFDSTGQRSSLTFLPNPYEKTRYYTIFEFGFLTRVSNRFANNFTRNVMVTFSLGAMRNINQKSAVGLMIRGESDYFGGPRLVLMPRYRRWLDKSRGLDISAGVIVVSSEGGSRFSGGSHWPSFVGSVSADLVKSLSVDLTLETLYFNTPTYDGLTGNFTTSRVSATSLYMGLNGKGYPAIAGAGAFVILLVIALATWNPGFH